MAGEKREKDSQNGRMADLLRENRRGSFLHEEEKDGEGESLVSSLSWLWFHMMRKYAMDMMKDNPRFMLAVLFLCLFLKTHICHGADRISGNQTLTVSDRFSSVLRISDGNLVLFNESQIQIWSTNVSSSGSSSVQAVLEDNGNLVLKEGSNNSRRILWESFDHPAHTWLPGSKLGYNNITKKNQRLISWRTSEDPAPGLFSLELDTSDNSYKILWNGSVQYWTSGPWNENTKIFDRVPEMRLNYIYDFHFVSNNTEKYFTYSVKDNSTTSRFLMDVSGQIKQQNWLGNGWNLFWSQPRQQCEVYAYCGAYGNCNEESLPFCNCVTGFEPKSQSNWDIEDYSVGCRRKTPLQSCGNNSTSGGGNGERDKFLQLTSMSLPNQSLSAGSAAQCESTCLNNCSCTAYSLDDNDCLIWIGDFLDLEQLSEDDRTGKTFHVRLAASELPNPKKKNGVVIGVAVGSAVGISVFLCLIVFQSEDGKVKFFPTWAASVIIDGGDVLSLLDPSLERNADVEEITRVCRVACWCIQDDENRRPTMGQIVQILEGVIDVNLPPVPRSLQVFVDDQENVIFYTESSSSQSSQTRSNTSTASSQAKSTTSSKNSLS
ncbi:hypothetical protein FEM48_Zijuj04G0078300 [Ziziphus jujuba var. spinosa]|uniref:G-type lectin S-receptor-like serine/threonine-protein kinase At2g19130 n=1 Tax=Ziziphus jujuba var. spinosa TaxID=714518 RepID=A0A978VIN6_ZIZJJ|nr:hypothetical protein FEM48_Zijuj04G0078300 [Ziziphus jujuba var. spinosa]